MIVNDLDDYYIVFDTKNRNTELDTLINNNKKEENFNALRWFPPKLCDTQGEVNRI